MKRTRFHVTNWTRSDAPTEIEISDLLQDEGLKPTLWSKAAGYVSELQLHPYDTVVYVLEGGITFRLPENRRSVNLATGDRMDLPAFVVHNAVVGPDGVTCVQGKR